MKRFIDSVIRILINTIIIIVLLAFCFIAFIFIFSKTNGIAIQDTVSYIKTFGNEITNLTLADNTEQLNITLNDSSENNITLDTTNNKFYYNQIDDNSKLIYNELEANIDNLKKDNFEIDFSTKFNKLLNESNGQYTLNRAFQTAIDAFFYDHPELFYIDLAKMSLIIEYISIGPKTTYTVSIQPTNEKNYLYDNFSSEQDIDEAILKIETVRNNIIANLSPDDTEYSKALKVHDILVNSLEYDSTSTLTNSHNIYGALVEYKVVCEGYAKAFKYILDGLDIDCILVSGTATNSSGKTESHMWNYIKLDNNWYGVDVTWDDPVIIGEHAPNIIRHDYFCKGYNTFKESHIINNRISDNGKGFSIPTLSSKNYK